MNFEKKRLFEVFNDYFKIGTAVAGIFYDYDETVKKHKKFKNFIKSHTKPANMQNFKIPPLPKPPFAESEILAEHFNLVVAENDTKMCNVYPNPNEFNFSSVDKFISLAKKNTQAIRWHTLVWHSQSPEWIFKDENGEKVSKKILENRLKNYIYTVGKRYAKDICSVDVVNECISDKNFVLRNGAEHSKWYDILGEDYIDNAFFWAKEAFPNSSLVINDYNLETNPAKRMGMYNLVKGMLKRGVPVDTVGLQMHINLENPPINEIEQTFLLFASLGLKVIITEMDVSVYKDFEPGKESESKKEYTKELLQKQAERYVKLFECFKNQAKQGILTDVVFWGISDRFSWKNDFPVPGRTDAPLLFDAKCNPKPAFFELTK